MGFKSFAGLYAEMSPPHRPPLHHTLVFSPYLQTFELCYV